MDRFFLPEFTFSIFVNWAFLYQADYQLSVAKVEWDGKKSLGSKFDIHGGGEHRIALIVGIEGASLAGSSRFQRR